jgi:NADPH2:quinone reductase
MRAAWCERLGPASTVVVAERPDPRPGPRDVLIGVRAAAVNYPDVLIVAGSYQVRPPLPFTPGSEFAGEVLAVGSEVSTVGVGDNVIGATFTGAFAEKAVVPCDAVHPLPASLDFVHGAAFRVTHTTAYHALVTIGMAARGDAVVVLGAAGGVGLACVNIGRLLGLRMVAAASSADRIRRCLDAGAVAGIDYSHEDLKQRIKDLTGDGADVVIDPVGGDYAEPALRATRWGGRFVTVGFASGHIPRIPLNLVLLKGVQIRGFEIRTLAAHMPEAVEAAEPALAKLVDGGLRPYVSAVYPLGDVARALEDVAQRRTTGKVVLDLSGT